MKDIKRYEDYLIKIEADGYETNEFSISDRDFNDRKKIWEVLLRKQKVETPLQTTIAKLGAETTMRTRCSNGLLSDGKALFVLDGKIMPNAVDINPDDVEDYSILQGPAAAALFGPEGSNGAIIIRINICSIWHNLTIQYKECFSIR